ncbi:MAG: hypothetical protein U1E45_15505 [Geminicoccaceae bacterium]
MRARHRSLAERLLAWLVAGALLVLLPPVEPIGGGIEICTAEGVAHVAFDPFAPAKQPARHDHCQYCFAGRAVPILPVLPQVPAAAIVLAADLPLPPEVLLPSEHLLTPPCRGPPEIA